MAGTKAASRSTSITGGPVTADSGSIGVGQVTGKNSKVLLPNSTLLAKGSQGAGAIKSKGPVTITTNITNDPSAVAAAAQQAVSNVLGTALANQANLNQDDRASAPIVISPLTGLPSAQPSQDGGGGFGGAPKWVVFLAIGAAIVAVVALMRR